MNDDKLPFDPELFFEKEIDEPPRRAYGGDAPQPGERNEELFAKVKAAMVMRIYGNAQKEENQ